MEVFTVPEVVRFHGLRDFHSRPERVQRDYFAALEALSMARTEQRTIRSAAAEVGISYRKTMRYIRPATERDVFGRTVAKKADRLFRPMEILSEDGPVERAVYGSRKASRLGAYDSALGRFLAGDANALRPFRGERAARIRLATEPDLVEGLARSGVLDEYEPYPRPRRR
jgi:hypothetical protein